MRLLLMAIFLLTGYHCPGQPGAPSDKARAHSERIGSYFGLDKSKINKLYYIDKEQEAARAKVLVQFKDSLGRKLAYGRLERRHDGQYQEVLTKEQYKVYREMKKQLQD